MPTPKKAVAPLEIDRLKQGRVTLRLIGRMPLYYNSMSVKTKRGLLIGNTKKSAAEKKELKHIPEEEFRDSLYKMLTGPTALGFPAPGVKQAMATAALETAGVSKTNVQRLVFMPQEYVPVWGIPLLKMDTVRSADINKTPDVRTRGFLRQWCAEVDIAFTLPTFSPHAIISMMSNAGLICGLGDFRQEKGKGSFGTFDVTTADAGGQLNDMFDDLVANAGREAQEAAIANPQVADEETRELFEFLVEERQRRAA